MVDSNENFINKWLSSPTVIVILLSAIGFGLFFIAEHNFLIIQTENFVTDIEEQETWSSGGSSKRRIAFLGCAVIGVMSLLLGKGQTFRLNMPIALIAIYLLWAGASVAWSIDTGATVRRYILMVCCAVGTIGFCRFTEVKDVVLATVIITFAYLILGVATEIVYGKFLPHTGSHRFAGTLHPNIQAAYLAMGCISSFTMARVKPHAKLLFYGIFGVFLLFLVLTKCRSATATVPVALVVIWFTSQPTKHIFVGLATGFWFVSFIALACLVSGFDPISEYQEVLLLGRGEETGSSLTGRLPLWEDLSLYISFKPWHGYGFGAFWTPRHINDIAVSQEWVISEAHSSYVEAALQLGLIGTLIMSLAAISTFFCAAITFRKTQRPEYLFLVGGVFFSLVRGFTESGMSGPSGGFSYLFLAIAAHSWHAPSKLIDTNDIVNNDSDSTDQTQDPTSIPHG